LDSGATVEARRRRRKPEENMTYKVYNTAQGSFCIDWETCCQIIRSYQRASLQMTYSKEKTESQSSAVDPRTWGLPDLTFIEVNWGRVRSDAHAAVLSSAWSLGASAMFQSKGVDTLVQRLRGMQFDTRQLNSDFQDKMRAASKKSWKAMESSLDSYESKIYYARLARDFSGSILIGAATVVTGGVGLAATAGMGTVLKTTATYQDTGSAGAAVIEATQNIVCTVIPVARGKAMGTATKVVISTVADTGKALLEGKSIGTAIAVGAVNVPTGAGGGMVKDSAVKLLGKVAAPIVVKVAQDQAKKFGQTKIKNWSSSKSTSSIGDDARTMTSATSDLADQVSFEDDLLLKLAVIDMAKGVGRSWW
jgi:hypothetical protein